MTREEDPSNISDGLADTMDKLERRHKIAYRRPIEVETSREVIAVLRARHDKQLCVFSSYSNPDGTCPMGNGQPQIDTWYGFREADFPLYHLQTTWLRDPYHPHHRLNEEHNYWLCLPHKEDCWASVWP